MPDVKHKFATAIPDDGTPSGGIGTDEWNDVHVWPTNSTLGDLTLATGDFAIHFYEVALTGELALQGTAEISVLGWNDDKVYNVLGTPRSPRAPFRIPNGHDYKEIDELGLTGEIEGFIEGDAELYLANFNDSSELVISGRTS